MAKASTQEVESKGAGNVPCDKPVAQAPPPDEHANPPRPLMQTAPVESRPIEKRERAKWTDVVQALCAVGLLGLGTFGYFYTVVPTFQKERLAEDVARLENERTGLAAQVSTLQSERSKLEKANRDLMTEKLQKEEEVAEYARTIAQGVVIPHFLIKIQSGAQDYKCRPIVLDLSQGTPRPPVTGEALIEGGLKDSEFLLLHDADRVRLVGSVHGFVAKYLPAEGFKSQLEIQHGDYYSGSLAIAPRRWSDPFHFSKEERQRSERAFQAFDQAMIALQKYLLPRDTNPIMSRPCRDLGVTP